MSEGGAGAGTGTGPAAGGDEPPTRRRDDPVGTVFLVGSGPGDPDLLTVKSKRLIESADVVLHDKLPGPEILGEIPEAKREDVGKRAGGEWTPQEYTNRRMVELAEAGNRVVRLKGGDPFVFGRGGEEAEHLAAAGIPFEVVPGVTSAIAGPAVAGIPVTHRDHASSVSFVTGHEDPTKDESAVNWDALAATGGTVVVLMGVGKLPAYATELRDAGLDGDTPVALVERATWPDMRVATGTLDTIVDARDEAGIEPPAITVIGDVAATRDRVVTFLENAGSAPVRSASEDDGSAERRDDAPVEGEGDAPTDGGDEA
ncbi:uroporphyrinogen-III C-methyltransferase [Halorubrum sp. BOL3-1]|uniref:uroporphyrinogen-III C-methyltransferase n=1 Tax=Halorubrum sp. BOL3-1 TaxID=2497325 RepID=UPI001004F491|nr:uroporphyrinogen-III C-methyltransferase [Halorubrum sp. BOL3-1]QAU13955.1 uroporphyrinogen-III C-methyltransferase [Halorubrum sp. BOL3-1]